MAEIDGDDVLAKLVAWAASQEAIRAVLLTSTRAVPGAKLDAFSDYDVILVVRDVEPFATDRGWVTAFGDVLVAYWDPVQVDAASGAAWQGNVVHYEGGLKIDFTVWPVAWLASIVRAAELPAELDAGYRVLLDRDGLAGELPAPTFAAYVPAVPNAATFYLTVNDFLVDALYVAKCLLRDELLPAKWCLDHDMRHTYLIPMLEWRMECDHGWSVTTGALGKGLKRRLDPTTWQELERTYAGAGITENWESLERLMALFRRVAREVAERLGYRYPDELERRVAAVIRRMQETGAPG